MPRRSVRTSCCTQWRKPDTDAHAAAGSLAAAGSHTPDDMKPLLLRMIGGLALLVAGATPALASTAYMQLHVQDDGRITGQTRVSVDELTQALDLDADADDAVTWPELQPLRAGIEAYLVAPCSIVVDGLAVVPRLSDLVYGVQGQAAQVAATLKLDAGAPVDRIEIDCSLSGLDLQQHPRSIAVSWPDRSHREAILDVDHPRVQLDRTDARRSGFLDYLVSGVWHIWIGYDHILFLIALLIPSVLQRRGNGRVPASTIGVTLWDVALIVTAFTLTHSITLSLAMLGWVELPPRLVEAAIALSVAVAALNNLLATTAGARGVWIALLFGLLHGFGFANVFDQIDAEGRFWTALIGFNVGVEAGQIAIVAVFVPVAFWLRATRFYRVGIVYGGSMSVAALASVWMVQRVAG